MANKLWRVGKKLTLWGALASALPFLFLPLMCLSALSVAFFVPLGCLVGSFICLRKFYTLLYQKTLVGFKRISVMENSEPAIPELPSIELDISDFSAENAENESMERPFEEVQPEEYPLQKNNIHGETSEDEENLHEREIHNGKPHEEEEPSDLKPKPHEEENPCELKPHEVETQMQSDPHTIPMEKSPEEDKASGEETQWIRENEEEALERATQFEEKPLESETQLNMENEEEALESENQLNSEELLANPIENTSRVETKHKRDEGEVKEEEVSDEIREIPFKRSRHEEHEESDSAQSAPQFNENNGVGNSQTLEIPSYSAEEGIPADSPPDTSSFSGSEYDAERANEATGNSNTPSLEVHVSSDSSNSVSEGTFEEDFDCVEKIWEEIHAVRKIVGYTEDPHPSYAEEIKTLYVFTGVEPPGSLKDTFDMVKAKEKLEFLKVVVGVK